MLENLFMEYSTVLFSLETGPSAFCTYRFASGENQPCIQSAAFQPFGQGPRHCIGKRLALMEAKMALVHILRRVRFTTCEETQVSITDEYLS